MLRSKRVVEQYWFPCFFSQPTVDAKALTGINRTKSPPTLGLLRQGADIPTLANGFGTYGFPSGTHTDSFRLPHRPTEGPKQVLDSWQSSITHGRFEVQWASLSRLFLRATRHS